MSLGIYNQETTGLNSNQRTKLQSRITEIAPLLEVSSPFNIRDADLDSQHAQTICRILKQNGAVNKIGRTKVEKNCEYRNAANFEYIFQWEWEDKPKQFLKEYLKDIDQMPCGEDGHQVHIHNPREVDGLSCKYCIENGEMPEFDKETIRELL
jgi:hypothetical protein